MPRFLDFVQFDNALHNQAFPLLDALAANDNLRDRSLTRFERDDPPPYAESTESEELEDGPLPPLRRELLEELDDAPLPPLYRKLPEELQSIMDQPICSSELEGYGLEKTLQPGNVYHKEARLDQSRVLRLVIEGWACLAEQMARSERVSSFVTILSAAGSNSVSGI